MLKLCDAQVGDTVILKGVVNRIEPGHSMYVQFPNNMFDKHLPSTTVVESITSPPWVPKVGDIVDIEGKTCLPSGYTILNIHGDGTSFLNTIGGRRWVVVAFKGDMPEVFHIDRIVRRSLISAD